MVYILQYIVADTLCCITGVGELYIQGTVHCALLAVFILLKKLTRRAHLGWPLESQQLALVIVSQTGQAKHLRQPQREQERGMLVRVEHC
jgi:hypothetical protein